MDILVLGGAGQVGTELRAFAWPEGVRVHAPDRATLDITEAGAVAALAERDYAAVINTAAYTRRGQGRGRGRRRMAPQRPRPCPARRRDEGARHPAHSRLDRLRLRRDQGGGAYEPGEPVNPQSVYGASKAAGEFAVRTVQPRHAILRTAWS